MQISPYKIMKNKASDDNREDLVNQWMNPLIELSMESPSLILGYGGKQPLQRSEMVPYFHVCGRTGLHETLRVLIVGGWLGHEINSTWVITSFLTQMEQRMRLLAGIEITAYPIINRPALREGSSLTSEQKRESTRLWQDSPIAHVDILEQEMWRYDYDLAILVRESTLAHGFTADVWPAGDGVESVISDSMKRYASADPEFSWSIRPSNPRFARSLTPVPDRSSQPSEIALSVPGAQDAKTQANDGTALLLTVLHAARQARAEGLL